MSRIVSLKARSFIPKSEVGDSNPLTWYYKEPDFGMSKLSIPKQKMKLSSINKKDKDSGEVEFDLDLFQQMLDTLAYCLLSVDNLLNEDGSAIVLPKNVEEKATVINQLPRDMMIEVYRHIIGVEEAVSGEEEAEIEKKVAVS